MRLPKLDAWFAAVMIAAALALAMASCDRDVFLGTDPTTVDAGVPDAASAGD